MALPFLAACTADRDRSAGDTLRVQIPWYANGSYQLQMIPLFTVSNLVSLKGSAARFLVSPGLENGRIVGREPHVKLIMNSQGVSLPTDAMSLELVTLYAHFEKLQEFDSKVGTQKFIQKWPIQHTIAVETQFIDLASQQNIDNAYYNPELDAFLFVPYSRNELPLSLNAGVIGHEYFHSIFHRLVVQASGQQLKQKGRISAHDSQSLQRQMGLHQGIADDGVSETEEKELDKTAQQGRALYHALLLRGLNEGLADIWGWLYSGDYQFVKKSHPDYEWRDLDQNAKEVLSKEKVQEWSSSFAKSDNRAYDIGKVYARQLFSAGKKAIAQKVVADESELRLVLAKAILNSIVKIQKEFSKLSNKDFLEPLRPLEILQQELPKFEIMQKPAEEDKP